MDIANLHIWSHLFFILQFDSNKAYPLVIAAHPSEENQFALGLIDGAVHVLEPSESEDQWGTTPPVDNSTRSGSNSASGTDQPPR